MDDQEDSDHIYYLRSKRRKTDHGEIATCSLTTQNPFKRKSPIMLMPLEILQAVFKYIPYNQLSERVRKVNRKFKLAAEDLLNKTFKGLAKKLDMLTSTTFRAIEVTRDDMELKCLCRLLNLVDIVNFQQTVIMATIWRYVYNEYYRTQRCCMYGGLILDLYDIFLYKFNMQPYQIYAPAVVRDYDVPDEIRRIIRLTKNFCLHFDKVNEETMKYSLNDSSCKIIDLLDCAAYATRNAIFERVTNNTFSAKYCYYFPNAWFIAFGIPPEKDMPPKHKQRMMHMRIRRIILAHTDMFMHENNYEREILLRNNHELKKPSCVVYTGYGDVYDTFYCYGAMNEAAYLEKYQGREEQNDEDVEDEIPNEAVPHFNEINALNEFLLVPHLGLDIVIRIDCPLAYAPYKYIKENEELIEFEENHSSNGRFNMTIEFNFPGALYSRLPTTYHYHKKFSIMHH